MSWYDFIVKAETTQLYYHHIKNNKLYLDIIKKLMIKNQYNKVLETGAGTGYNSLYFEISGYDSRALDNDKQIVDYGNLKCKYLQLPDIFFEDDIKDFGVYIEVIHNNGVLEHFKIGEVTKILKHHKKMAEHLVIAVPNHLTIETPYGNEVYNDLEWWVDMFERCNLKLEDYYAIGSTIFPFAIWFKICDKFNLHYLFKKLNRIIGCNYIFIVKC